MHISYDTEADAIFVRFADGEGTPRNKPLDHQRYLVYDQNDELVGVELLQVSRGVSLEGIPRAKEIADAIRPLARIAAA